MMNQLPPMHPTHATSSGAVSPNEYYTNIAHAQGVPTLIHGGGGAANGAAGGGGGGGIYATSAESQNYSNFMAPPPSTGNTVPTTTNVTQEDEQEVTKTNSGDGNASSSQGEGDTNNNTNAAQEEGEDEEEAYTKPVKLFVGQVPKTMEEADLFPIFEKYGPMEDIVIIRDKHTGQHRGCAFVTFLESECAQVCEKELHNKFVLAGGRRPVQIRPAGKRDENDDKIFVGMLPRDIEESIVRELFEPFGEITGIYLIRSTDGIKKGCAFVKFTKRESALAAIETMNGQIPIEGSERPLIVKFADTRHQKKTRQAHHHARRDSIASHGSLPHMAQPGPGGNYFYPPGPPPLHVYHPGPPVTYSTSDGQSYHSGYAAPATHASGPGPNYMYRHVDPYSISPEQRYSPLPSFDGTHTPPTTHQQHDAVNPRPREGPAGANLFIYHLPHDLTDADLATAFNPFGNVISAKVYVDRYTMESKGFGFVSFDSVISAENAIEQMNGFQIGSKRLKVQHKRVHHRHPAPPTGPGPGPGLGPTATAAPPIEYSYHPMYTTMHMPLQGDVPPSIEISSEGDDTATAGHQTDSQSTQQDVEGITRNFAGMRTEEPRHDEE